jgi:competence protein ComGC
MGITIFLVAILLWLFCATCSAQSIQVQRKGNTFVEVVDSGHKTTMVYIDKDGKKYPIYVSSKGKHYILKVSKKSGKQYKRYLPKVDEQLSKQ